MAETTELGEFIRKMTAPQKILIKQLAGKGTGREPYIYPPTYHTFLRHGLAEPSKKFNYWNLTPKGKKLAKMLGY